MGGIAVMNVVWDLYLSFVPKREYGEPQIGSIVR